MIPQGNSSTYALLPMKDIIGYYMGLDSTSSNATSATTDDTQENDNSSEEDSINFSTQLKK